MAENGTYPSSIMYETFRRFGGIPHNELVVLLFNPGCRYGGTPILDRCASNRTFITRNIVHVPPGRFPESAFNDLPQAAERLAGLLFAKYHGAEGRKAVVDYFVGPACDSMCEALRGSGLNDALHRNITDRIGQMELASPADKASLLVLQFIATGCLGDPVRATEITMGRSRQIVNSSFKTDVSYEVEGVSSHEDAAERPVAALGLCRVEGGKLVLPVLPLTTDPAGTEIGSLTIAEHAINDVGDTVSKRHARVYFDGQGSWYVEGLGSTNGTTIIRGDSKAVQVVEPPRAERQPGQEYPPVRLYPSDMLCLADSTRFMVLELASG